MNKWRGCIPFGYLLVGLWITLLSGCSSTPPVFSDNPNAQDKIIIAPSKYLDRIEDKRPEYQKISRLIKADKLDIQLLGDNVFLNSPLNEIASAISTWAIRNPEKRINLKSLLIHYGAEEIREIEPVEVPDTIIDSTVQSMSGQGISPIEGMIGLKLAELLITRMEHEMAPGGYTVVVHLEASVGDDEFVIQQIQAPVHEETPRETVAAALNNAGYKLSRQLLQ